MQFGARPDLRLSSGRYDRSDPIRSRTPVIRPTKYPTTIASTKHRIVVSGVSTMVYRQLVPQASERFDNHLGMNSSCGNSSETEYFTSCNTTWGGLMFRLK